VRAVALIFLSFLLCLSTNPALAQKRVALVVGISKYERVPQLANPARDANAIAALFRKAGFDLVDDERDLGLSDLRRVFRNFSQVAARSDIAVVYYAGHGIEVDGINYLVPADAKLLSDFDIEDETVSLDRVLRAVDPAKRLKLVILDACRDNPFAQTMKRSISGRSVGRGLAKVEPSVPDTLIAFAAKAGAVANDGDGQNSPFASALVKHITEPGLDLRIAFGRVRDDVLQSTGNRQEPFVYGSLGGATMALLPKEPNESDQNTAARIDYELAAQVSTAEAWDSFLRVHPTGLYADLARAQKNKLLAAEQARVTADELRRRAEELAAQKAQEYRKQLEEQGARQTAEAKQKLTEQVKKELEDERRRLAEQAKNELEQTKQQAILSQQRADAARAQVEDVRREAAAEAQAQLEKATRDGKEQADKLAAFSPGQPGPAESRLLQMDPNDIARLLQAHLKRVGCNPSNTDGSWDEGSRRALDLFNKNAQTRFEVKVASLEALDAVRGKADRVCPLICGKGQRIEGDHCTQIRCDSGYFLNSTGACERRAERPQRPQTASSHEPPWPIRPPASGGKCFNFGGKTYCE
jgi:uncharacterized caspase-like protein